jgi:hypothetical protein
MKYNKYYIDNNSEATGAFICYRNKPINTKVFNNVTEVVDIAALKAAKSLLLDILAEYDYEWNDIRHFLENIKDLK